MVEELRAAGNGEEECCHEEELGHRPVGGCGSRGKPGDVAAAKGLLRWGYWRLKMIGLGIRLELDPKRVTGSGLWVMG